MMQEPDERQHSEDELARRVAALPRNIEPPRDLWPEIEARLAPAKGGADVLPFRRRVVRSVGAVVPTRLSQVAAAVVWMGLGALFTWWMVGGQMTGGQMTGERSAGERIAEGRVTEAGATPAPIRDAALVPVAAASEAVSSSEVHYLRAKEELWLMAYRERENLSPESWQMVRRNLEILDAAIDELRSALRQDPGNAELEARLLDSHRRGLSLLRRLTHEV